MIAVWLCLMAKKKKPASVRVDLPEDETDKLDSLQTALKHKLGVDFVSKASTIRFMIRNFVIPATDQQQN